MKTKKETRNIKEERKRCNGGGHYSFIQSRYINRSSCSA